MAFKEKLTWILDQNQKRLGEKEYQINIDFVHSLGKKCDCVGWSVLNMDEPDAEFVLDEIQAFCKKNGWTARGWYERSYPEITSDWFELKTSCFKDATICDNVVVPSDDGTELSLAIIRAYHELSHSPKEWLEICVSERFRNACLKNNIEGIDFCWVQDKGKYDSVQWFYIYPQRQIARIACDRGLKKTDIFKIKALGGALPKIASIFSELQHIELPDCYLAEDMPSGGIAYAYCPSTNSYCGRNKILVHKETAQILISEKALSQTDLKPVCVLDACPKGYTLDKTKKRAIPTEEYMKQSLISYEKIKNSSRPARSISEKDALKVFRKAKSERKEDFQKRIGKTVIESVTETEYKLLLPYYQIANGGFISDEYELLSYEKSLVSTKEFFDVLEKEELLSEIPEGKVFAICADGDVVLVTGQGTVLRFGHEAPEIVNDWQTLAQFFYDAISENE